MHISDYIVLDLETTGLSAEQGDKIIEVAAIKVLGGEIVDTFSTLINPEIPLKSVITAITGIEEQDLLGAPVFAEIRDSLQHFIGNLPIVGHNIAFDIGFLRVFGIPLDTHQSLDTFTLATMFLPLQESYALEVLSHSLQLRQGTHRALDDVIACHDLLQYILRHIAQFSPTYRSCIGTVLQKANHEYAAYWSEEQLPLMVLTGVVKDYEPEHVRTVYCPVSDCSSDQENLTNGVHVFSYGLGEDYVLDAFCIGQQVTTPQLILFQNETKLQGFLSKYKDPLPGALPYAVILRRSKDSFISQRGLEILLSKESYTVLEGAVYAKVFAAMAMGTFDGTIYSLKLIHQEYGIGNILSTSSSEDNPWYSSFSHSLEEIPLQLMTHYSWALTPELPKEAVVRILQAQHVPKSVSYAARKDLSLKDLLSLCSDIAMLAQWHPTWTTKNVEDLEALCDIIWGTLGIWFTQVGAAHQTYNSITLESHLVAHVYFQRMYEGFTKFITTVRSFSQGLDGDGKVFAPYLEGRLQDLEIFIEDLYTFKGDTLRQVLIQGDQGLTLTLFYTTIHRTIIQWSENYPLVCYIYGGDITPSREGDQRSFFTHFFRKERINYRDIVIQKSEYKPLVIVPTDLPDPNNPMFFRESSRLLLSIFNHFGGQIMGSFASRHALERIFHYVYPLMKKEGIHVLVEGLGGSLGKLFYKYRADEEHSVLLGSNMLLEKIDMSHSPLQAMIIQKLPFGVTPQGLILSNKEKGFMEYGFPAMLMQLRGMFTACMQYKHVQPVFFLLDNRLYSSSYGKEVERLLREDMTIIRVAMKDIPNVLAEYAEK